MIGVVLKQQKNAMDKLLQKYIFFLYKMCAKDDLLGWNDDNKMSMNDKNGFYTIRSKIHGIGKLKANCFRVKIYPRQGVCLGSFS